LYKFRRRALAAIRDALRDHPRGPKRPHNQTSNDWEQKTISLCELRPTFSSYRVLATTLQAPARFSGSGSAIIWREQPNARCRLIPRGNSLCELTGKLGLSCTKNSILARIVWRGIYGTAKEYV
jgi:hypothetical protein